MAVAYLDSSCVVAVALGEVSATRVDALLRRFERLISSNLLEADVRAALTRERATVPPTMFAAIDWVLPKRTLSPELERVVEAGSLRGADSWHVACALYLDPSASEVEFVTLDLPQRRVASALGFATPRA